MVCCELDECSIHSGRDSDQKRPIILLLSNSFRKRSRVAIPFQGQVFHCQELLVSTDLRRNVVLHQKQMLNIIMREQRRELVYLDGVPKPHLQWAKDALSNGQWAVTLGISSHITGLRGCVYTRVGQKGVAQTRCRTWGKCKADRIKSTTCFIHLSWWCCW